MSLFKSDGSIPSREIGTERIGEHQKRLLRAAPHFPVDQLLSYLEDMISNMQEDEQVHPDWLPLIGQLELPLASMRPGSRGEGVRQFFEDLTASDRGLSTLDPRSTTFAFLLGAGASKPIPSGIPTVKELLPQLLDRARRLDRDDVTKLAEFCDKREIENIEDLLTAAHLATFCSRNPKVLRLVDYLLYRGEEDEATGRVQRRPGADLSSVAFLQDTLQVLFGLLSSTMLPAKPNPAHDAIAGYTKAHAGTSIVTTNYDCCMDWALGDVSKDFSYELNFANNQTPTQAADGLTRLIKLHGSLNWFYCETCQDVQLADIRLMTANFLEDKAPYPVIGICKDCGGRRQGLLVPPLAMKFDLAPPLTPLVSQASQAFEAADVIVVVGFSFADADLYISRLLSKSMQEKSPQKLLIVDPDRRVSAKVQRRFKANIPYFDPSRILRISGDCAEMLPKFLAGEFLAKEPQERDGNGQKPRQRAKAAISGE